MESDIAGFIVPKDWKIEVCLYYHSIIFITFWLIHSPELWSETVHIFIELYLCYPLIHLALAFLVMMYEHSFHLCSYSEFHGFGQA